MQRLIQHPVLVILIFIIITVPSLYLADRIELNNDMPAFLKKETKVVQDINTVADRLSGSKVINIVLKGNPGDFKRSENLKRLKNLTVELKDREDLDSVVSLVDYKCLVNRDSYSDLSEHNIERSSCQLLATRFVTLWGL